MENPNSIGTLLKPSETGLILLSNSEQSEIVRIGENTDPDRSRIEKSCIAAEQGQSITAQMITADVATTAALLLEVKHCAITYCASPNTDKEVINECVRFILSQYGHLNAAEIREAFRLAAAHKIEANMNAYHGQFAVRILGDVLASYNDFRTQIAREVRSRLRAIQDERENAMRGQVLRERFGTLSEQYQALMEKNTKYSRWQDLPLWFCERVVKEDIPKFNIDEKGSVWITAKHWAVNQLGTWISNQDLPRDDRKRYQAAKRQAEKNPDTFPNCLQKEAQDAYCKMLVFSKIAVYEKAETTQTDD